MSGTDHLRRIERMRAEPGPFALLVGCKGHDMPLAEEGRLPERDQPWPAALQGLDHQSRFARTAHEGEQRESA